MENSRLLGVSLVLVASLVGCDKILSEPTIDTSSDEAMRESTASVRESLPEEDRAKFDEAVQTLAFSQIDLGDMFAEGAAGIGNLESRMKQSLEGKTAQEVISEANRLVQERESRERAQALEEIAELEQELREAEVAKTELSKFEVVRSRFSQEERQFSGKEPIIEITVRNGTPSAVSRAYFEGTIASPNRSVPWLKETFNYSISGGLEPGEEQSWRLAPNSFSEWGNVDPPADAIFTVTVEQLDGADGNALYSTAGFTDRDRERLSELKEKYGTE